MDGGDWVEDLESDDCYIEVAGVGSVAGGHATDGSPLYMRLIHGEGEGVRRSEGAARTDRSYARSVLVAPVDAPAAGEPAAGPAAQQSTDADASAPAAVIPVLGCKNELVEITNTGGGPLDLSSWQLLDESSRKSYVFPAGAILTSGAGLRMCSGPGARTPAAGELPWKTASMWNDRGDTACREDPAGAVVASKKD